MCIFFVDGYGKMDVGKSNSIGKTDDTIRESILQSAKGLDFSRRNSYSDLSTFIYYIFFISVYNYSD